MELENVSSMQLIYIDVKGDGQVNLYFENYVPACSLIVGTP